MALFLPVGILLASGLLAISSVAPALFFQQILWIFLGAVLVLVFYLFDWRIFLNYRWLIGGLYAIAVALLIFVYFGGPTIRGIKGWLVLGPINFQPVELAKVALILLYAGFFSRKHLNILHWGTVFGSFFFFIVPAGFVALQPDLGSATILFVIWLGFLLLSGFSGKRLIVLALALAISAVVLWSYFLEDYQRDRIVGVFFPERNVLGVNYSVTQSKIAIGSAGFLGKGYGQGSQSQLGFVVEPASDFVLAVIVEEWGVFGALVLISAFLYLIFRIIAVALRAQMNFERFVCLGAVTVFGAQFLFNAGSALGLTPVVGVTFPFVSYGGSSMIMGFFLLALVHAIQRNQH